MKKKTNKLLTKLLTITLTLVMVFSSVLVVNTNKILADENDEPEIQEIIEEEIPELPEEEADDETNTPAIPEVIEETKEEEPEQEEIPEVEKESEQEVQQTVQERPRMTATLNSGLLSLIFGKKTTTYTVTFISDNKEYEVYQDITKGSKIEEPATAPTKNGYTFKGWFVRVKDDLLGLIKSEVKWDFSSDTVDKNVTLYAKFVKNSQVTEYFDFRVKHKDSYGVSDDEFLANHTTGDSVVRDSDGYLYSYYSYYTQNEHESLLSKLRDLVSSFSDYSKAVVQNYNYIMYEDQFKYMVVPKSADTTTGNEYIEGIDANKDGKIDASSQTYPNEKYKIMGDCVYVDDDGNDQTGIEIRIGEYLIGTAFDLAIYQANEGDEIQLLTNLYITKPIEIWGSVDFNLNKKTVLYDENSQYLDLVHYVDRVRRKSDIIIPDYIPATILVNSANTTVYNGTIRNTHNKGVGIIDISFDEDYKLTLKDIEVIVDHPSNTSKYAIESGYDLINRDGIVVEKSKGFIDVVSGKYHGYFVNNNGGDLILHSGARSEYDPTKLKGTEISSGVTCEEHYQIWNDGGTSYPYIVDKEAEVNIYDSYGNFEKECRTLVEALQDPKNNGHIIELVKDINLNNEPNSVNGAITLDTNNSCILDLNNKVISGSSINITNGSLTIGNSGYIRAKIYVKNNGKLEIADGNYYSIYNDTQNVHAINVTGGYFIDNLPTTFFNTDLYECLYNEVPTYRYTIVSKSEKDPITVSYIDDSDETISKDYKTFDTAMRSVNSIDGSDIVITLNKSINTNSTIEITRGLTIDLNGKTITSSVNYNTSAVVGLASIYINTEDAAEKVRIIGTGNGTIVNNSLAEDSDDVYGIYVENGNLDLENIVLNIKPVVCSNGYALYNVTNENQINIISTNIVLIENVEAYDSVETIHNEGTLKIDSSRVYAWNTCGEIKAIYNSGSLEIVDSLVDASGAKAVSADVYGVYSTGDVHVHKNSADTKIVANNNTGKTYGIYQDVSTTNKVKQIIVESDAMIAVTADNGKANGTLVYGIYTKKNTNNNRRTDILLGECDISVSSKHNQATGIYAAGGYVYAGTVNGQVSSSMFDQVVSKVPTNVHDNIYEEGFNKFAVFNIEGADKSVGIDCEYGTQEKVRSQLTNAIIILNCTGDSSYCAKASNSIIGLEILSGYFYSIQNNRMMSGKVFCNGGYYSSDVSLNTSKNKKCIRTVETDTKRHCSYDNHDYEYTIDGSNCTLAVSAYTTDEIALKIKITYDPVMLLEPEKYGIKITVDDLTPNSDPVFVGGMTIADYNKDTNRKVVEGVYTYNVPIPIKMISNNIQVEIVSFENGVDTHTYHLKSTFSVEQYFYDLLEDKENRTDSVRDLAAASLNMGAAAQNYFDYWVDDDNNNIANRKLSDYYDDTTAERYSTDIVHNNAIGSVSHKNIDEDIYSVIDYIGHSLELGGRTSLRFYFKFKNAGENLNDYTYECTHYDSEGKNPVTTPLKYGQVTNGEHAGAYYIEIENISLLQIEDIFDIKMSKGDKTYSVIYSPIDYIVYTTTGAYVEGEYDPKLTELMDAYYECYLKSKIFDFSRS